MALGWQPPPVTRTTKRLRVEDRPMDINDYIHGVRFLRELFTASVRVDHPVHLY
jgi:hypothetical protein